VKYHLLLFLLAIGILTSCSKKSAGLPSAYAIKTADFPAFIANPGTLNIVNFSASWCPPCQQLKPILESVAVEYPDTVRLGVVDVDKEKNLAAQQAVRGIPDVRFYIDDKLVDKFTGGAPKQHIEQLIAKHSKNLTSPEPEPAPEITTPETTQPLSPAEPLDSPAPSSEDVKSANPEQPAQPAPPEPTIIPSKGNPLPPGMSRQ